MIPDFRLKRALLLTFFLLIHTSCSQDNLRLADNAAIQGKASSEAQIQNENQNLARRVGSMELDLAQRQRFYQAIKGKYEGEVHTEDGIYRIRLSLVPSLPPYRSSRVRAIEEVAADLNNLYLNAHIVQWNPTNRLSAVPCRVSHIRPDIVNGEISIVSENCSNLYTLKIAESQSTLPGQSNSPEILSPKKLASQVLEGKLESISTLQGEIQPGTNASIYKFIVQRMENE